MASSAPPTQEETAQGKHLKARLGAAVRSIQWSYAIFWSISSTHPAGVLTWNDGYYNGEIKTRKIITNSSELKAGELGLQRSEQLRELYEFLLSGEYDQRERRPIASLSPEDLTDTEWYYLISMSYAFRLGQGLPGQSFASNKHVWLCNAQFADSKTFPRVLLAKGASIQTVVCIPIMSGVLELGTTNLILEDPDLIKPITTSFCEPQLSICSEQSYVSLPLETEKCLVDNVCEDLDNNTTTELILPEEHGLGTEVTCPAAPFAPQANATWKDIEEMANTIDEVYNICEEFDIHFPEDSWLDGSLEVVSSLEDKGIQAAILSLLDGSRTSSYTAWKRDSDVVRTVAGGCTPQSMLKKVVAGTPWMKGGSTVRARGSIIKNHVMSERRRREKLNEMLLTLRSLLPSVHKIDKASILAETIAYLKELQQRVEELESCRELSHHETRSKRRHDMAAQRCDNHCYKEVFATKRKASEIDGAERERHWIYSKEGSSKCNVTIMDKEVELEVQCQWRELLMTQIFEAIRSLHLDVLSTQSSIFDGSLALKIRAKFVSSDIATPGIISEALQRALGRC